MQFHTAWVPGPLRRPQCGCIIPDFGYTVGITNITEEDMEWQ
jgi:hypothetical protein